MTAISVEAATVRTPESAGRALAPKHPRIRLDFLDGIRGLASLDIAFCHAGIQVTSTGPWGILPLIVSVTFSQTAVAIFIVLSGYCLMLPVVRSAEVSADPDSRQGVLPYLGRRARRILPAYYATLVFCLIVMALIPQGPKSVGNWWSTMWPAFTPGVLISHLFLVHNFSADWIYKINAPMWSIATEWQIYFLFPLLLLPLHRRCGAIASIGGGTAVSLLIVYLFPGMAPSHPWFLALFALGMQAAANYPGLPGTAAWRRKIPWGWTFLITFCFWCVVTRWGEDMSRFLGDHVSRRMNIFGNWKFDFLYDLLSGVCVACFLSWAAARSVVEHATPDMRRSVTLRALASAIPVRLGAFSYSLYLIHAPVQGLIEMLFSRLALDPNIKAISFVTMAMFASVAFAYAFSVVFEKPFLRRRELRSAS